MDAWESSVGHERGLEIAERLVESGLNAEDAEQVSIALCLAVRALAIIAHNDQPPWIPTKRTPTQAVTHQLLASMAIEQIMALGRDKN